MLYTNGHENRQESLVGYLQDGQQQLAIVARSVISNIYEKHISTEREREKEKKRKRKKERKRGREIHNVSEHPYIIFSKSHLSPESCRETCADKQT